MKYIKDITVQEIINAVWQKPRDLSGFWVNIDTVGYAEGVEIMHFVQGTKVGVKRNIHHYIINKLNGEYQVDKSPEVWFSIGRAIYQDKTKMMIVNQHLNNAEDVAEAICNILNNRLNKPQSNTTKDNTEMTATKTHAPSPSRKPSTKTAVVKQSKPGKPAGAVSIVGDMEKSKRPLMISDMAYKQIFIAEGRLQMRVLNVCDANRSGKPSNKDTLWVVDIAGGRVRIATDIPVELVDVEITITNKAEKV